MSKLSLKDRIYNYIKARPGQRIPSGEIQRLVVTHTKHTPANATRRLRELAEDGLLAVDYDRGHAVYWYEEPKTKQVRREEFTENGVRIYYETVRT